MTPDDRNPSATDNVPADPAGASASTTWPRPPG